MDYGSFSMFSLLEVRESVELDFTIGQNESSKLLEEGPG